ncbi:hypothetical protein KIN20_001513 [Parelaphostrongylus tenuis]|uniref:Uncharacterized protein n=1 Tax=Parelaphostrongylus tenuis TaxID=148309 RepID=A0AAD5MCN4_PARTN|nr:hypothetical protein KIN20_001513 [Parelaphostrongylus tenuis]
MGALASADLDDVRSDHQRVALTGHGYKHNVTAGESLYVLVPTVSHSRKLIYRYSPIELYSLAVSRLRQ